MKRVITFLLLISMGSFYSCGGDTTTESDSSAPAPAPKAAAPVEAADPEADAMNNKGIGPVTSVELGELDLALAEEGKALFEANCTACHKIEKKYIGPALSGLTERRTPEWIMNMIINPTEMVSKDPLAKRLLAEANGAIMADQNISEEQARAMLEYFRTL